MSKFMKRGQAYKQLPNGDFVEVNSNNTAPVPQEELPPDLRSKEVSEPAAPAIAAPSNDKKAAEILNDIKAKVDEGVAKVEADQKPKSTTTEADRYAFLRALVANKPFKKEYALFGGKMKVSFRTVTAAEAEAVTEAIIIQSGRVPYSNVVAMSAAHLKYSMACSLAEITREAEEGITIKKFDSPLSMYSDDPRADTYYVKENSNLIMKQGVVHALPGQKVLWASVDHFSDIPIPIYNMIFKCFQQFDTLVAELAKEATDPDFFTNGESGQ